MHLSDAPSNRARLIRMSIVVKNEDYPNIVMAYQLWEMNLNSRYYLPLLWRTWLLRRPWLIFLINDFLGHSACIFCEICVSNPFHSPSKDGIFMFSQTTGQGVIFQWIYTDHSERSRRDFRLLMVQPLERIMSHQVPDAWPFIIWPIEVAALGSRQPTG